MYADLAKTFVDNDHDVTIIAPDVVHSRSSISTDSKIRVVRVASKRTQGVSNMIKKGFALATLPIYYKAAYNKYLKAEKFDWIVMPTPPITLSGFVEYVKSKTGAKFYLILRDIHPQSVWSIGLLHNRLEYRFLDRKAQLGYQTADLIGCMSQGNIDFVKNLYPGMKIGECVLLYNWVRKPPVTKIDETIRARMNLQGCTIALFGGNLGKGQRIENIIYLAEHYMSRRDIAFLVIAKGVEKERLQEVARDKHLDNIVFKDFMPQADYINLTKSVDIGLVSINENYRVPTCPSKAVSYMAAGVPVFAMINPNNDYGQIIENAGAGYWTVGSDKTKTIELFDKLLSSKELRRTMSKSGKTFYHQNCTVEVAYRTMITQILELNNE